MFDFNPRGRNLGSLEKNILKYRTFEMVMILFYVEEMKTFSVRSIQVTDEFRKRHSNEEERLPNGTKKVYKKLWRILVDEGVLSEEEKDDIEKIIDYRNDIAHSIHELVFDLNLDSYSKGFVEFKGAKYDYGVLDRLKLYRDKIGRGLQGKYIIEISMNSLLFDPAGRVYEQELKLLDKKIRTLLKQRKDENHKVESEIKELDKNILDYICPYYPVNFNSSGQLTTSGIKCIENLFQLGLSKLAVSYIMRLSLKSVTRRKKIWSSKNS